MILQHWYLHQPTRELTKQTKEYGLATPCYSRGIDIMRLTGEMSMSTIIGNSIQRRGVRVACTAESVDMKQLT